MAVLTFGGFGLAAGTAFASPTGVGSLAFDNGGTLSGFFTYDATNHLITDWDLTSTAFGSHQYLPGVGGGIGNVLSNSNNDQVLLFDQSFSGVTYELDIVFACNGHANCIDDGTLTTSFAVVGSHVTCPPGTLKCISSGEQPVFQFGNHYLLSGYLNLSDPPVGLSFNVDSSLAPGHTVYDGSTVPEPTSLALVGIAGLAFGAVRRRRV
jgi:hypothetical protein